MKKSVGQRILEKENANFQFAELSLEELEHMLDVLVETGQIRVFTTNHEKLYCTDEYYDYLSSKE